MSVGPEYRELLAFLLAAAAIALAGALGWIPSSRATAPHDAAATDLVAD